jgi:hydrogenase nickel incorporation protein HypA/HybF
MRLVNERVIHSGNGVHSNEVADMHELGISQEVVEIVLERAKGAKVARVVLEIGKLAAVLPDALHFCFDLCTRDTDLAGAQLEIIELPGKARCLDCGKELTLEQPYGQCTCGNTILEWLAGEELRIKELELA